MTILVKTIWAVTGQAITVTFRHQKPAALFYKKTALFKKPAAPFCGAFASLDYCLPFQQLLSTSERSQAPPHLCLPVTARDFVSIFGHQNRRGHPCPIACQQQLFWFSMHSPRAVPTSCHGRSVKCSPPMYFLFALSQLDDQQAIQTPI